VYGNDRVFAYVRLKSAADVSAQSDLDAKVAALEAAGHPVVTIEIEDLYEIFGQFFTWEIATAVAGSVMGINPFNQPDVEAAKIETRTLTTEYEKTGELPERQPVLSEAGIELYATEAYAAKLRSAAPTDSLTGFLRAHLDELRAGDYFAALAFLPMFPEHEAAIQVLRHRVRDRKHVATCLVSDRAFCTRRGRITKAARTRACFCRSPPSTPRTRIFPARNTVLGW
jgi:hypothetical protein